MSGILPLAVLATARKNTAMKRLGEPERGDRKRRPIPWLRYVEIAAVFAALSALLVVFYVLFGGAPETLRRFAVALGYEDSYIKHCKASLAYYLKTYASQRLVQDEYVQDADPHDVRLAYDAQDSSGELVRGEFHCLYRPGSAFSSDFGPRLDDAEVNGRKIPLNQIVWIELFGPMEMQQDR